MDEWHFSAFSNKFLVAALPLASSPSPRVPSPDAVMARAALGDTHPGKVSTDSKQGIAMSCS